MTDRKHRNSITGTLIKSKPFGGRAWVDRLRLMRQVKKGGKNMRKWQHIASDKRLHFATLTPETCSGHYLWRGDAVFFAAQHGEKWEYLTLGCDGRYPRYDEICAGKDIFFSPSEICIQYYSNRAVTRGTIEKNCVQLWHNRRGAIRTPRADNVSIAAKVWAEVVKNEL